MFSPSTIVRSLAASRAVAASSATTKGPGAGLRAASATSSKLRAEAQHDYVLRIGDSGSRGTALQIAVGATQKQVPVDQVFDSRASAKDVIGAANALEAVVFVGHVDVK